MDWRTGFWCEVSLFEGPDMDMDRELPRDSDFELWRPVSRNTGCIKLEYVKNGERRGTAYF
jgi:hypothetical protein